jgi:hypothetical protein
MIGHHLLDHLHYGMCLSFLALSIGEFEPVEGAGQIVLPTLLWHQQRETILVCKRRPTSTTVVIGCRLH